jgi:hypothetical protein
MANLDDTVRIASRDEVIAALKSEREYQSRRWGLRQSDGTFKEAPYDAFDFLMYMHRYNLRAIEAGSDNSGCQAALDMFRKVAALGIAYFEQKGQDPYKMYIRELVLRDVGVAFYILTAQKYINHAIDGVSTYTYIEVEAGIFAVIEAGIACFEKFGITPRDLTKPITNARDNQPA